MSGPGLIDGYLAELSADLPERIVEELADGLEETYRRYLGRGLVEDAAARAAVAEFGEPRVVMAAFTDASRGRRTARRLLAAGWRRCLLGHRADHCPGVAVASPRGGAGPVRVHASRGHRISSRRSFGPGLPTGVPGSSCGLRRHRHRGCGGDRHGRDYRSRPGVAHRRGGRS